MLDPLNIQRPKRTLRDPFDESPKPSPIERPTPQMPPANRTLGGAGVMQPALAERPTPVMNRTLSSSPVQPATEYDASPSRGFGGGSGGSGGGGVSNGTNTSIGPLGVQQPARSLLPAGPVGVQQPQRAQGGNPSTDEAAPVRSPGFSRTLSSGVGKFGEPVYDNASIERMGTRPGVTSQHFGTEAASTDGGINRTLLTRPTVEPQAITPPYGIQRPQVASTYGLSVTDPRMQVQEPQQPDVALRGADAMAEAYNAREDREARQKLAGKIDDEIFRLGIGGFNSRGKRQALSDLSSVQAGLISNGENIAANAIQGRAQRANVLANTDLEQAGADRRAQLAAQGNADIAAMGDATRRAEIAAGLDKHETITAADGRMFRIGPDNTATLITDDKGQPVRAAQPRDPNALTPGQALDSLGSELKAATDQLTAMQGINGTATPEQVQQQQNYVTRLQGEIAGLRNGGAGSATGNRQKPSWEQFQARAKAQGSRLTPAELKAHYDQMP